ncbi:MAG: serine/threonine-protein phosphatase [Acidobacteriota bacterium]|nr:serine/threonine-protein phosphatase [Acidobacteriota bacterium]
MFDLTAIRSDLCDVEYDIFEAESGEIAIVLGDVSGKGIPAALLVSVLQRAIRSSTTSEHEYACERINRMLCERTACERFATLFWGVFDPVTRTLRYVNAGQDVIPNGLNKGVETADWVSSPAFGQCALEIKPPCFDDGGQAILVSISGGHR